MQYHRDQKVPITKEHQPARPSRFIRSPAQKEVVPRPAKMVDLPSRMAGSWVLLWATYFPGKLRIFRSVRATESSNGVIEFFGEMEQMTQWECQILFIRVD